MDLYPRLSTGAATPSDKTIFGTCNAAITSFSSFSRYRYKCFATIFVNDTGRRNILTLIHSWQ